MKNKFIHIILLTIAFSSTVTGCGDNEVSSSNDITTAYFKFIEKDEVGDKKSIYFDGNKVSLIDDELDSLDVLDGRGYGAERNTYTVEDLISFEYPLDFTENSTEEENSYHFINKERNAEILVSQIDYNEAVEELNSNSDFKEKTNCVYLADHNTEYFKQYKLYTGIQNNKIGFILVFESSLKDVSYMIEVYDIGNLENIKQTAALVMNSFEVLWNYEE